MAYGVAMNSLTLPIPSTCPDFFKELMKGMNIRPLGLKAFLEFGLFFFVRGGGRVGVRNFLEDFYFVEDLGWDFF